MAQLDYIIYGATLEGLLVASYLHQRGFRVTLFEPSAKLGGCFSPVEFRHTLVKSVFSSLADSEKTTKQLQAVAKKLNFNLELQTENLAPTTFEKGHFEPFVGFGENAPKTIQFLGDFFQSQRLETKPAIESWIQAIAQSSLPIRYQTTATSVQVENNKIISIGINDKETIRAENFIFACPLKDLSEIFEPSFISAKATAKISKTEFWSTIQFSVVHNKQITNKKEIHFLYGTQKDPVVSIGVFNEMTSQWISMIPSDSFDIHEEGVLVLKEMKRQIRRAYPEAFENVVFEKIALLPETHGRMDLKEKNLDIAYTNLNICSAQLTSENEPLNAAIAAADAMIEGFGDATQSVLVNSDHFTAPKTLET